MSESLDRLQNHRYLFNLPTVPMPYVSEEALLPLPSSPWAGLRSGWSLYPKTIDVNSLEDTYIDPSPMQD